VPVSVFHPDVALVSGAVGGDGGGFSSLTVESDNVDYGAVRCRFRQHSVRFRVGKVTPTKVGLFVTAWRRSSDGSTEPFPADDDVDVLVISAREGSRFGVFVLWSLIARARLAADSTEFLDNSTAATPFRRVALYERGLMIGASAWPSWVPEKLTES
jgi:hypothetical protein